MKRKGGGPVLSGTKFPEVRAARRPPPRMRAPVPAAAEASAAPSAARTFPVSRRRGASDQADDAVAAGYGRADDDDAVPLARGGRVFPGWAK
jgi:hypothetical protein